MSTPIAIANLETQERVYLQNVPRMLEIEPEANHYTIRSSGANLPKYHYTGGENKIAFATTLYSDEDSRDDVVETCRKLESWSKNDGFRRRKPRVLFSWGSSLFSGKTYIIFAIRYVWKNFNGEYEGYPMGASLEITLAEVSDHNPTHSDIQMTITPQPQS